MALVLGACAGAPLPAIHYYTLRPPAAEGVGAAEREGAFLGVAPLAVDPPYDQDRLAYRRHGSSPEIGFYAYHRWASPLGQLVAVALADGLQTTAGVGRVEPARSGAPYDARLQGRVRYLEQVGRGASAQVRLGVDLQLVDARGAVLWWAEVRVGGAGAPIAEAGVMPGLEAAIERLLGEVRAGVADALREQGGP